MPPSWPDPADAPDRLLAAIGLVARERLGTLAGEAFLARLELVHPDVEGPLRVLYGERTDVTALVRELVGTALDAAAARPEPLRVLDRRREVDLGGSSSPARSGTPVTPTGSPAPWPGSARSWTTWPSWA